MTSAGELASISSTGSFFSEVKSIKRVSSANRGPTCLIISAVAEIGTATTTTLQILAMSFIPNAVFLPQIWTVQFSFCSKPASHCPMPFVPPIMPTLIVFIC